MRPLSAHALGKLRDIASRPLSRLSVNPGVAKRLLAEALVESVQLPSPWATHKGANVEFLQITGAGRRLVAEGPPMKGLHLETSDYGRRVRLAYVHADARGTYAMTEFCPPQETAVSVAKKLRDLADAIERTAT